MCSFLGVPDVWGMKTEFCFSSVALTLGTQSKSVPENLRGLDGSYRAADHKYLLSNSITLKSTLLWTGKQCKALRTFTVTESKTNSYITVGIYSMSADTCVNIYEFSYWQKKKAISIFRCYDLRNAVALYKLVELILKTFSRKDVFCELLRE